MIATTLTDERALATLESELRPLLAEVQTRLADAVEAPGHEAVARFLTDAPVLTCVRLAETWTGAATSGVPHAALKDRFHPDDHALIELVTSIYAGNRPDVDADCDVLSSLLDESVI